MKNNYCVEFSVIGLILITILALFNCKQDNINEDYFVTLEIVDSILIIPHKEVKTIKDGKKFFDNLYAGKDVMWCNRSYGATRNVFAIDINNDTINIIQCIIQYKRGDQ